MLLRRLHLGLGVVTLVAFVLTGQYMDRFLNHLHGMSDGPRMLYRTAHIYLLFSGLLNVLAGIYFVPARAGWRRVLQGIGVLMLLSAPLFFAVGFFREGPRSLAEGTLARPFARQGIYACAAGVLLQWVGRRAQRTPPAAEGPP
jgi:hypothetical protein